MPSSRTPKRPRPPREPSGNAAIRAQMERERLAARARFVIGLQKRVDRLRKEKSRKIVDEALALIDELEGRAVRRPNKRKAKR